MIKNSKLYLALAAGSVLWTPTASGYNLTVSDFGNTDNLSWQEASSPGENTVEVTLPDKEMQYFKYTYTPDNRTIYTERLNNLSGDIDADFVGIVSDELEDFPEFSGNPVGGGVIYNNGKMIDSLSGNFIGNIISDDHGLVYGAIYNTGIIGSIAGSFVDTRAYGNSVYGGVIANAANSEVDSIKGYFINNTIETSRSSGRGGAIWNDGNINEISGSFIANSVTGLNFDRGGAIHNGGSIGIINANFIDNYGVSAKIFRGGAIYNDSGTIEKISGNFIGNHTAGGDYAQGGAIHNTASSLNIINANFIDNYVLKTNNNEPSNPTTGGAIYSSGALFVSADNTTSRFSGNYIDLNGSVSSNAVYMEKADLNLSAVNNGVLVFDDAIDGEEYDLNIAGDGTGVVQLNNTVSGVQNLTLSENSVTHLGVNANISTYNMSAAEGSSPLLTVDIAVNKNSASAGSIAVENDVSGDYRVLVNALSTEVPDNPEDAYVAFLSAPNDNEETPTHVSVARVIGSPYMWDATVNAGGEESGSTWYLNLTSIANPDYNDSSESPDVAPEIIAAYGLQTAAREQTRSVVRNVFHHKGNSPVGRYDRKGETLNNVWTMVQAEHANIDKPVDAEADIWGIEAGFDLQKDHFNTLGLFASYRKGEYDFSGNGKRYSSTIGAETDIDSYLAGLYYRYDKNMGHLFAAIYAGQQSADIRTDDRMAKFDTDGLELGAAVEIGHAFVLPANLTLEPEAGIYWTRIDFDKTTDNVGKKYKWDDANYWEAELGLKLNKHFDNADIYFRPSVIQTFSDECSVYMTGLDTVSACHDQTLGKVELGGEYGLTTDFSLNGKIGYTFGSSYEAATFNFGLQYAF